MKKIALFISSLQKGGSERVMVNLAEFFYRNHYDVLLVTQYKREDEYEILRGYILSLCRINFREIDCRIS